jgi:hypothetical protein
MVEDRQCGSERTGFFSLDKCWERYFLSCKCHPDHSRFKKITECSKSNFLEFNRWRNRRNCVFNENFENQIQGVKQGNIVSSKNSFVSSTPRNNFSPIFRARNLHGNQYNEVGKVIQNYSVKEEITRIATKQNAPQLKSSTCDVNLLHRKKLQSKTLMVLKNRVGKVNIEDSFYAQFRQQKILASGSRRSQKAIDALRHFRIQQSAKK